MNRIFLDSNLLVAIFMRSDPNHERVSSWINGMVGTGMFMVSPQIIAETYATVTSPTKFQKPLTPRQARAGLSNFLSAKEVNLMPAGETAINAALMAAEDKNIRSRQVFDLLIWGTMVENDIKIIATFNARDFQSLPGIKVITPG
jgi:predicted nucleic acid-binding protein